MSQLDSLIIFTLSAVYLHKVTMKKILILGGGSAGWMAATAINQILKSHGISVTLVESPAIGTIGVGEGSTPHLQSFFEMLQVPENEWMPYCGATFKNGISFVNWTLHLQENRYFHPFPSAIDRQTAVPFLTNCMQRHMGVDLPVNPDDFFLAQVLSKKALGPKAQAGKHHIPMNYAYHFDSIKLGEFLAKLGKNRGVSHIEGKFIEAKCDEQGNISAIILEDGSKHVADFFIDASGFTGHLLQQQLKVQFESFANNLFNDSAIALPSITDNPILAQTTATALSSGWAWHIPLVNRTGNGYVFSSQYISFEQAEKELRQHLHSKGIEVLNDAKARHIPMKVGQVKQAWRNNVMAIGLAQGFIEPLEATALHLVVDSLKLFLSQFKLGKYNSADVDIFNQSVYQRYQGIRDYIVCHYKVNSRHLQASTNDYWKDCANMFEISENLKAVLSAWENKQDITPVIQARNMGTYYPVISWYCLLAGYGYYPHASIHKICTEHHKVEHKKVQIFINKMSTQFEKHQHLLDSLNSR